VLSPGASSSTYYLRTLSGVSGEVVVGNATLVSGLNYGSFDGIQAGIQRMQILDEEENIIMQTEQGPRGVSQSCEDGIWNMNYEVVGLKIIE